MPREKKTYPAWQYLVAGLLLAAIGLTYTVLLFHLILGPGFLVGSVLMFVKYGRVRQREADATTA